MRPGGEEYIQVCYTQVEWRGRGRKEAKGFAKAKKIYWVY